MPEAGLKELLEAGVHFGHQTRRWNPNMRRYIFGELDGIHIIDLVQTETLLENARRFAGELSSGGGTVLFVGTKKQARGPVKEWADRCKMPYVNQRWLGGLLTNFNTISARIARLHELTEWQEDGQTGAPADQGANGDGGRAGQARVQPRRRARYGPTARRRLRHRLENRGDRGARGGTAADSDHRPGRHQLRPEPDRLRGPRQRRRDSLLPARDRHDRERDRRGRRRLAGAGGTPHRRGNGAAAQGGRGAPQARGGREGASGSGGGGKKGCRAGFRAPGRGSCLGAGHLVLASCGRGTQSRATREETPKPGSPAAKEGAAGASDAVADQAAKGSQGVGASAGDSGREAEQSPEGGSK